MVKPKISGLEKPEGMTVEHWADFGAAVLKMAGGDQPRFAFVATSLAGRSIAWAETGADVLDHVADALCLVD
jgi:hypothetical protein